MSKLFCEAANFAYHTEICCASQKVGVAELLLNNPCPLVAIASQCNDLFCEVSQKV
jgi:hypothetical protein